MRTRVPVPLALILATACASSLDVSAQDALTQTAIAGEEESLSRDNFPMNGEPPQPLFRGCDAQREYDALIAAADADGSGTLEPPEEDDVAANHPPPFPPEHWRLLAFVYDTDRSRDLDEAERAVILDDFTARCEALHARLLAEFDADGSGDLDEEEMEAARQALEDRRPPPPPEGCHPPGPPPEDGAEGPAPEALIPPPFRVFDTDGDGALSDEEFATLQAEVRLHIRNGDPPPPPPPCAPPPEEG